MLGTGWKSVLMACLRYGAAAGLCCALLLSAMAQPAPHSAASQTLSAAAFVLSDAADPPGAEGGWATVALPDNWSSSRRDVQGIGWYRMQFDYAGDASAGDASAGLAVLVQRICMNGEIFVNGVRVLSGGNMSAPITRNWNTPFFVEIPSALLKAGPNRLDIRVFAYRNSNGGLGTVQLGPSASLRAEYGFLYALHVKGAIISFAVAMVAAFAGGVAWWRMNRDPIYGFFGLAMLAWTVRYFNYFV